MNPVISEGLFPFILLFLAGILYYYFIKIRYRASSNELVQAMFTLMVMSYIMLTVIGIWLRGPGMALTIG